MWRKIGLASLTLLVAVMALGAVGAVHASSEGAIGDVVGFRGQIVALTGASLTVQVGAREVTVLLNEDTRYRVIGDDDPGMADLAAGEQVLVRGRRTEEDTLIAWWVGKIPAGQPQRGRLLARRNVRGGSIVSLGEGSLMLETPGRGTITVVTDGSTDYRVPGIPSASLADFEVGDVIVVLGKAMNEDLFLARLITAKPAGRPIAGTIATIDDDVIVLTARSGETWTLLTDDGTRFHAGRCPVASDSFAPGDRVVVLGDLLGESNTLLALHVARRTFRPACRLHPFAQTTAP